MVRPGRDKLGGVIEVDETLVGGEDRSGKRGRGAERKAIVVIALEIHEPVDDKWCTGEFASYFFFIVFLFPK